MSDRLTDNLNECLDRWQRKADGFDTNARYRAALETCIADVRDAIRISTQHEPGPS